MSIDPQIMAMLLKQQQNPQAQAFQQAQAPGQLAMSMGNAPAGTNSSAGITNALSKLALAMMQRKRMQDYQRQYGSPGQPAVPTQSQGQTLSGPIDNSSAPAGMMGPP